MPSITGGRSLVPTSIHAKFRAGARAPKPRIYMCLISLDKLQIIHCCGAQLIPLSERVGQCES